MSFQDDFQSRINKMYGDRAREFTTSDYNLLNNITRLYGSAMSAKGLNLLDPIYSNLFYYNKIQNTSLVDFPRVTRSYVFFTRPECNFSFENIQSIPFFKWLYAKPIGRMVMSSLTDPDYFINAPSALNSSASLTREKYNEVLNNYKQNLKTYSNSIETTIGLDEMMKNTKSVTAADYSDDSSADSSKDNLADVSALENVNIDGMSYEKISDLTDDIKNMNDAYSKFNSEYDKYYKDLNAEMKSVRESLNNPVSADSALNIYLARNILKANHNSAAYDKFNFTSPFIPLLGNTCKSLTGAKALSLENYAYEEDDFSGNLQVPTGMDSLWGSGSLTAAFDDIAYGPDTLLFLLWIFYIHYVSRGYIATTRTHVMERILDYTCSIYVFVIGSNGRTIERFCKYTGCYPTTLNVDSQVDFSDQPDTEMLKKVQVGFNYNRYEVMNPEIFTDFNYLSESEWLFKAKNWKSMYDRTINPFTDHLLDTSGLKTDYQKMLLKSLGRPESVWDVVSEPGMSGKVPRALINGYSIDDNDDLSESDMISNYWGGYPYIDNGSDLIWVMPRVKKADSTASTQIKSSLNTWKSSDNLIVDNNTSNKTNESEISTALV